MNDWLSKWPVTDYVSAMHHLANRSKRVRGDAPIGNALRLVANHVGPDSVSVVYHKTPVVTYYPNGGQVLNWGGWYTKTTFEHIGRFARLGDFRLRTNNRQRNGHGDGVALSRDSATWPRTPSRVTRCRACKGTGVSERWGGVHECWNCKGAGRCERGRLLIPEVYTDEFQLVLYADGTYEIFYDSGAAGSYACRCSVCRCGCGNWQSHWLCTQETKQYTPIWASPPVGAYTPIGVLDAHLSSLLPKQSSFTMHSEVLNALAAVLPNLDHEVTCPKCRTSEGPAGSARGRARRVGRPRHPAQPAHLQVVDPRGESMSGMQENILGRVKKRVEGVGLQYVQNARWSNMGTIRVMRDLEVVVRLDYAFYDSYGELTFSGPLMERQAGRLDVWTVYGVRDPNPRPADLLGDAWQSPLGYDDVRSLERPMVLLADLLPEQPTDSAGEPMAEIDINPRHAQAPADPTDVEALLTGNWDGDGRWRDDDSPHDNTRRAGFAGQALIAYAGATRHGAGDIVDPAEVIGDFLCDLRHLCDALGLDFDTLSENGRDHYDTELRGE